MLPIKVLLVGGAGQVVVAVPADNYEHIVNDPLDAECNITFSSTGTCSGSSGVNPNPVSWRSPTGVGVGSAYWIRWTNTVGTLSTGSAGSWLQLSSNRTFGVERTSIGSKTCTGTVEIARDALGADVVASGSITLLAEVD